MADLVRSVAGGTGLTGCRCSPVWLCYQASAPEGSLDIASSTSRDSRNRVKASRRRVWIGAPPLACALIFASAGFLTPARLWAQASGEASSEPPDSVVSLVPGPHYNKGGFFRWLWGTDYRREWNTRIQVPLLDLGSYAGGLRLLEKGGPGQTRTLFFQGADGGTYVFRSTVKDLPGSFLGVVGGSTIYTVLEDQNSALHPAATVMSALLATTAGVLHAEPRLFVMPDDPMLGEYREEFGGMLGTLVLVSQEGVIDGDELFDLVQASPADRVDAHALLGARLVDMLIGDWDRDRLQWRWARLSAGGKWKPIAEDHDEAFVRLDGLLLSNAHFVLQQFVGFGPKYPSIAGLTYTGQELDRRFLAELERPAWDSIAARVTARITDEVIERAVRRQPPGMYAVSGERIVQELGQRRDALQRAASDFYEILAGEVEVHASDAAETVWVTGMEGGAVEVVLAERREGAPAYFRRRFFPTETREIRIRLYAGDDVALLRGDPDFGIRVRLIGGSGDDEYRFVVPAKRVGLYDQEGVSRITGAAAGTRKVNTKPYPEWRYSEVDRIPPRQSGNRWFPSARVLLSSDFGLFVAVGAERISYAFRKDPYSTKLRLLGGISTDGKVEFRADYDRRFENSKSHLESRALLSQLTQTRFYGFGNDTQRLGGVSSDFFRVDRTVYAGEVAGARFPGPTQNIDVSLGVQLGLSVTGENEDRFISLFPDLYGTEDFAQVGFFLNLEVDKRDVRANPTKGFRVDVRGTVFPGWLDVVEAYGALDAFGAYYVTPRIPLRPTIAVRAGSRKVWSLFPYFQAAYIGGTETLRGYSNERFAGDLSLYGGLDLRVPVVEIKKVLPGPFGVVGLVDVGRVWLDGESPGGFHVGYGGGIWTGFLGRGQTVSLTVAFSDEQTSFYVAYGFSF